MNGSAAVNGLTFLRPYLYKTTPNVNRAYLRLFNTIAPRCSKSKSGKSAKTKGTVNGLKVATQTGDVEERVKALSKAGALVWPRVENTASDSTVAAFISKHKGLEFGKILDDQNVVLRGRVLRCRVAGKSLAFFDIMQDGQKVQVVCNFNRLRSGIESSQFRDFFKQIQRGDIVSVTGNPCVTDSGQLSLNTVELPTITSPSLAALPTKLEDPITRIKHRHIDMLVNREVNDRLRVRSHIIRCMRDFFHDDGFLEVQTPLLADKASGAIAKSFKTAATEFPEKELALRIAPELWLKRLIIGGMDRVFEIGPSFRNEGLDSTHNPEFTTCEFYKSYADLDTLMSMTEELFTRIAKQVRTLRESSLSALPSFDDSLVAVPFSRIEFVPGIEAGLGEKLPDLEADDATEKLIALFQQHSHPLPSRPTLPRLLDRLASIYIEPSCTSATFIINHPACMAPLAKSFICPMTKQLVSARAELFIQHHEIANMYEEENSPFEQRAKFVQQGKFIDEENEGYVDESYISALESGLPPTGGWGAGIDRIVMLFSGTKRIADVLSFGSLRNVVYLGHTTPIPEEEESGDAADPVSDAEKML